MLVRQLSITAETANQEPAVTGGGPSGLKIHSDHVGRNVKIHVREKLFKLLKTHLDAIFVVFCIVLFLLIMFYIKSPAAELTSLIL